MRGTVPVRNQRVRTLGLIATAGTALGLYVASPSAAFTTPVNLTPPSDVAVIPAVAMNRDGDSIVAWSLSDGRIQARMVAADGTRGAIVPISGPSSFSPGVAIDADGEAIAVWSRLAGGKWRGLARTLTASGEPGPKFVVARGAVESVATDADGDSVVTWTSTATPKPSVHARIVSATGTLGPTLDLSLPGQNASNPRIAVSRGGAAIACWSYRQGAIEGVQGRTISPSGSLGPLSVLSPTEDSILSCNPAIDSEGDSIVVWEGFDSTGNSWKIGARRISATSVMGSALSLQSAFQIGGASVAVDREGDAVAVWTGFDLGSSGRARTISTADVLGPITGLLWDAENASQFPRVVRDFAGNALIVAGHNNGNGDMDIRRVSPAGVFSAPEPLAEGTRGSHYTPAASPGGRVIIVWLNRETQRIQATLGSTRGE